MFKSELDYSIEIDTFKINNKLNNNIISLTNDFITNKIDRKKYIKKCYKSLEVISDKSEDKNKYLLYNISNILSLNVRYMYNVFFINNNSRESLDLLLIILSRLNDRAKKDIFISNYKLSIVIDYYKTYSFINLIVHNLINDECFKSSNKFKKLLDKSKKLYFKEFRRLKSYYNIKKSNKNNNKDFSKLKIDLLKIDNLNKEMENIIDYNNDIVISYIVYMLNYILFLYYLKIEKYLKINN